MITFPFSPNTLRQCGCVCVEGSGRALSDAERLSQVLTHLMILLPFKLTC